MRMTRPKSYRVVVKDFTENYVKHFELLKCALENAGGSIINVTMINNCIISILYYKEQPLACFPQRLLQIARNGPLVAPSLNSDW